MYKRYLEIDKTKDYLIEKLEKNRVHKTVSTNKFYPYLIILRLFP